MTKVTTIATLTCPKCHRMQTAKMFVNGQKNKDFENYLIKDGDNLDIKYE